VAGVVKAVVEAGLHLEVTTEFEIDLALQGGSPPERILLNGIHKPPSLLERAIRLGIGGVVVDSAEEIDVLERRSRELQPSSPTPVYLGVGRAQLPRRADPGAITGTRKGSPQGVDVRSGDLQTALKSIRHAPGLTYRGPYLRAGNGLRDARHIKGILRELRVVLAASEKLGLETTHLFLGGGFGTPTSRELSTREMLFYQGRFVLPPVPKEASCSSLETLAREVARTVRSLFGRKPGILPALMIETGPYLTGPCQVLLVRVNHVKLREGVPPWVVTDGGAGSVAFPLYYEIHEVLNGSRADTDPLSAVTMVGPICYSTDWIYRNKAMPPIHPGDVLSVLDTGAYFSVLECNFGFLRPAVVGVCRGEARLLRHRETPEDVVRRDTIFQEPP
jgi:diaminopimelate decarboxylase